MSEGKIKYDLEERLIQFALLIIDIVDKGITECKELISIFVTSIETARKNKSSKNT